MPKPWLTLMRRLQGCAAAAVLACSAWPRPALAQAPAAPAGQETDDILPILPAGISDFDVEFFTSHAYTSETPDGRQIIECLGNFTARMGRHRLSSREAVVWFDRKTWQEKPYYDMEVFLWQDAEVRQPGDTVESGPALLVTLRTFGRVALNADAHAAADGPQSDVYAEALRARGLLDVAPAPQPEEAEAPVRVAPTAEQLRAARRARPPTRIEYSADQTIHEQHGEQSVIVAIGDVSVSQGSSAAPGEYLELRADAAVLYVNADALGGALPAAVGGGGRPTDTRPVTAPDVPAGQEPTLTGGDKPPREAVREWVSACYLEGDVVLSRGHRMIRASRLYYDFENDRALILDVVARALEESRGLPIYVRAETVRQLSVNEYVAENAQITTSEFHTPHVAVGAGKVYLTDRTPRNERGEIIGVQAGTYTAYNTTLNVEGAPLAWWPVSRGDFSEDRMAFRSAKMGYSSDFGGTLETQWYLFNLLGIQQPEGYDATLRLDYFTDRGPAAGIDMDYEREDHFGLLRTYYINDRGEDDLGRDRFGNIRGGEPDHENRGRVLWRHRQYLPKDWELSLETAYLSDDNFLESFERNEFENAKDQETLAYLLKRRDNWQFSTLLNYRINEFQTETEHLPDAMFSLIGEPLGDFATFYHESRAGVVRYRPDNRRFLNGQNRAIDNTGETGSVVRGDTREEAEFPLALGPVKLSPYVMARGTAWDDMPWGRPGDGRAFGSYGVRGNVIFSKVDETVESDLLDLHHLRHVVKLDGALWNAHANLESREITPFDPGVESIDDFGGGTVGVRQRWQTKRGGPGRWRTVDWIVFDVEAGFFDDKRGGDDTHGDFIFSRPEDSISSNFVATNFQYRLSDSTVLVHDGVYDANRGNVGTSNISLAVEREPRLAYFVGWRYIHDTDSNLFGFGGNYKLSEKHTVAIREYYDIDEGRNASTELVYIRKWPRWYTAVSFEVDRALDDVGVNLSIWPEGAPRMALGSKRYTGLTDSVGIRP